MKDTQHGGFVLGAIFGVLVGLVVALGVALYIAKVPVPFVNKVPQRTAEQDQAETDRNKNWDPNAPLGGKGASKGAAAGTVSSASAPTSLGTGEGAASRPSVSRPAASAVAVTAPKAEAAPAPPKLAAVPASGARPVKDPAAILSGEVGGSNPSATASAPARKSTETAAGALVYYVQAGAYTREEEAESQRARVALQGLAARVTEREQSGRTVYRVRLGPFNLKDEAEGVREKLKESGVEALLVTIQR
jgi:cell division protein FtsN